MKKIKIARLLCVTLIFSIALFPLRGQSAEKDQLIKIETIHGEMIVKLYHQTPAHRDNMIKLINEGFYDGQLFHRVIKDFMVQGGDPHSVDADRGQRLGTGGPGYTIPAEFNDQLFHKKGTLSAARMGDQVNPEKASSGSQFYIVQGRAYTLEMLKMMEKDRPNAFTPEAIEAYTTIGGTPHLDGGYTVFGEVVKGLEVVDRIAAQQTDSNDRPLEDVVYHISLVK
ncbi:MAG: peptidylprolyl isomerase [Bacteroidetes bacterium]|nr:peptidylprolyl isomerase [Bacteroidota bacterium]